LDPEDIKILSLGATWNFGKGTGLSWADIWLWGTKGPSIKPMCIGTVRARTQCKSINQRTPKYLVSQEIPLYHYHGYNDLLLKVIRII